jgi:hypothetical protein
MFLSGPFALLVACIIEVISSLETVASRELLIHI